MNQRDFLAQLCESIAGRLPSQDIEFMLTIIEDVIKQGLIDDDEVRTPFGIFKIKERKARRYRDISSGEIKILPTKNNVIYKTSKSIEGAINGEKK